LFGKRDAMYRFGKGEEAEREYVDGLKEIDIE
jgi:hypothetical protein